MRALVTGASSGIGREVAKILSSMNVDVILVGRDEKRLLETKEMLKGFASIEIADLSNPENCFSLYNRVRDIDILVNNAGFGLFGDFSSTDLSTELNMIDTNVKAVHILTKLYLADMKEKNDGYILNVPSVAGFLPGPLMATYYSTKSYVLRLSESIYEELRREHSNVSISCLCPGPTNTDFFKRANVVFRTPYASAYDVAKYAVYKMFKRKLVIIPGFGVKLLRSIGKFLPDKTVAKFIYLVQSKRKKAE